MIVLMFLLPTRSNTLHLSGFAHQDHKAMAEGRKAHMDAQLENMYVVGIYIIYS